jgi:hypothetical protein
MGDRFDSIFPPSKTVYIYGSTLFYSSFFTLSTVCVAEAAVVSLPKDAAFE